MNYNLEVVGTPILGPIFSEINADGYKIPTTAEKIQPIKVKETSHTEDCLSKLIDHKLLESEENKEMMKYCRFKIDKASKPHINVNLNLFVATGTSDLVIYDDPYPNQLNGAVVFIELKTTTTNNKENPQSYFELLGKKSFIR